LKYAEVATAQLDSLLHVDVAQSSDDGGNFQGQLIKASPIDGGMLVAVDELGHVIAVPRGLAEDQQEDDDSQSK
jgi:hypothetical protein